MSEVKVNKLSPRSGTTVTLGDSGDTISIPSGVTLSNAGTNTFASATITGDLTVDTNTLKVDSTNNRVGIGTSSPSGNLHINSGTTNGANTLVVESDNTANGGAVNPVIVIRRNNTGVTRLGGIYFQGLNSSSSANSYALIEGQVLSDTAGSESGYLRIGVQGSGSLQNSLRINSSGTINFMQSGGGIYLGTTTPVSANLLDDYEEGTWTPTYVPDSGSFTSVTYASTAGEYTKIGNTVYFTFYIQTNAITVGSASGAVTIGGLPFAPGGGAVSNGGGTVINASFFAGDKPSYGTVGGSSEIFLFYTTGSTANDIQLNVTDLGTGSTDNVFQMMGTYITTA